jgi:hypothetical protein
LEVLLYRLEYSEKLWGVHPPSQMKPHLKLHRQHSFDDKVKQVQQAYRSYTSPRKLATTQLATLESTEKTPKRRFGLEQRSCAEIPLQKALLAGCSARSTQQDLNLA